MSCADRPPTRQELREQTARLVALVNTELGELAIAIGSHAANDDDGAAFAQKIRERVKHELAAKLQQFQEMIVIT